MDVAELAVTVSGVVVVPDFQFTTGVAEVGKLLPAMIRVCNPDPATTLLGVSEVKTGPLEIVKDCVLAAVPVLVLMTPICAVPLLPSRLLGMDALRVVTPT
jgi:hypothetical protein